jgi:exopolyphosphatase/guanosine-5'-triphosphate,3'-diphosphate pyrophosphatase
MRLLKRQISNLLANVRHSISTKEASSYIALGGDVRFAAGLLADGAREQGPVLVGRDSFLEVVDLVTRLSIEKLVQKYAISYMDAETLAPALLTYAQLLKETQAQNVLISGANIRAGILLDLVPVEQDKRVKRLAHQILSAARNIGRKYQYDEGHAERVRGLCELLFDELKPEHRMTDTQRIYLEVAALLHDIGLFISSRGHHKHSQYLISASGLFGLRQRELDIIANVARYHRRALPQRSHPTYMSLDRDERMLVSKLAAILRVANSLDKEHLQKITDMKVIREGDQIVLLTENAADLTMERVALAGRSDLFADAFGKKIELREAAKNA